MAMSSSSPVPSRGEELACIPAHRPDVAIIHAQKADREGNVLIEGIVGVQKEAVLAARRSVVTVEEVVDDFGPRSLECRDPAVVDIERRGRCVPGGARPSYAHGYYSRDNAFYIAWDEIARDRDRFRAWMQENVMEGSRRVNYTPQEMMTVAAARALSNDDVCFVGIGLPSAACNLARLTHAPRIPLIYESGTLETRPGVLPLSIGDGELCETALTTVSVPEIFRYWLQGGRIIDRLSGRRAGGSLRQSEQHRDRRLTQSPKVRLPGSGGATEIATGCGQIFIVMKQGTRSFVRRARFPHQPWPRPHRQRTRRARRLARKGQRCWSPISALCARTRKPTR